jgi:hypothetical protein
MVAIPDKQLNRDARLADNQSGLGHPASRPGHGAQAPRGPGTSGGGLPETTARRTLSGYQRVNQMATTSAAGEAPTSTRRGTAAAYAAAAS